MGQFWVYFYKYDIFFVKHQGMLVSLFHLDTVCNRLNHLKSVLLCGSGELLVHKTAESYWSAKTLIEWQIQKHIMMWLCIYTALGSNIKVKKVAEKHFSWCSFFWDMWILNVEDRAFAFQTRLAFYKAIYTLHWEKTQGGTKCREAP